MEVEELKITIPKGQEIDKNYKQLKKEKKFIVYRHVSPSGKVYIGITCKKNVTHRWGKNGSQYIKCPYFWKAIQKYGWDNIKHEILFTNLSEKEAKAKEIDLIAFYKSNNPEYGYNLTEGGEGRSGYSCSKESIEKMSKSHLGHKDSEETKRKKSLSRKGKNLSKESIEKLRKSRIGRTVPEGVRIKIRNTLRNNSVRSKSVLQYTLDGKFIREFISSAEAGRITGADPSEIRKVVRGIHKQCKGFIWKEKV